LNGENDALSPENVDGVCSIRYDLVWGRVLQTSVEKVRFKPAGNSEDVVPSFYATLSRNILIDEL
jgi:hypothetical protein